MGDCTLSLHRAYGLKFRVPVTYECELIARRLQGLSRRTQIKNYGVYIQLCISAKILSILVICMQSFSYISLPPQAEILDALLHLIKLQMHYPTAIYLKAGDFFGAVAGYSKMVHPPKITIQMLAAGKR